MEKLRIKNIVQCLDRIGGAPGRERESRYPDFETVVDGGTLLYPTYSIYAPHVNILDMKWRACEEKCQLRF
ncbi:hypothetical protein NDU88_003210 [Pleurodeles waltl]|uniref:Uncharacterized protein n=1 Tax=Pleurodeles waltl TaxID=8319 RepID=A0AAV7VGI4_PLEWA|nr:hypothetical protein NDU88_003210 [Pleurodeles waltl]